MGDRQYHVILSDEEIGDSEFLKYLRRQCDALGRAIDGLPEDLRRKLESWWDEVYDRFFPEFGPEDRWECMAITMWANAEKLGLDFEEMPPMRQKRDIYGTFKEGDTGKMRKRERQWRDSFMERYLMTYDYDNGKTTPQLEMEWVKNIEFLWKNRKDKSDYEAYIKALGLENLPQENKEASFTMYLAQQILTLADVEGIRPVRKWNPGAFTATSHVLNLCSKNPDFADDVVYYLMEFTLCQWGGASQLQKRLNDAAVNNQEEMDKSAVIVGMYHTDEGTLKIEYSKKYARPATYLSMCK